MPCPHCKITIIKRSNNESAVSAAAYQSGEKLFSEYDQEQKYYPYKPLVYPHPLVTAQEGGSGGGDGGGTSTAPAAVTGFKVVTP